MAIKLHSVVRMYFVCCIDNIRHRACRDSVSMLPCLFYILTEEDRKVERTPRLAAISGKAIDVWVAVFYKPWPIQCATLAEIGDARRRMRRRRRRRR